MTPEQRMKAYNSQGKILIGVVLCIAMSMFLAYKATDNILVVFAVLAGISAICLFIIVAIGALECSLLDRLEKSE